MIPRLNSLSPSFGANTSPRAAYNDLVRANNAIANEQNQLVSNSSNSVPSALNGFISMQGKPVTPSSGLLGQKLDVIA